MAQEVTDATFDSEVLKSDVPVLVDFWAPWCGPCQAMLPVIDEITKEYDGKAKVVKINVDENNEVSGKFNVMSIPTFILFKGGEAVDTFIGAKPKEDITAKIDAIL